MKKKWLIGFLAASMALTVSLGIAACGKSGKNNDEEIATSAIEQIKALYKNTPDSDSKYEVTGQVRGSDQTLYDVTWTAIATTQGIDIDDYVSVGEMDATSKSITITLTMGEQAVEFDLQASVTVGKVTKTTKFSHKLNAKPSDAKGTKDDPYSTRKVIEIASGLGTVGSYYYSEADKGKDVPTRVWVKGYIIDCGNGTKFAPNAVGWIYIAESKDSTKDSPDALCLFRVEYDEENLTCFEDLAVGKEIMVNGFIEWYQDKNDSAPYAEIASFKTASGYESVYCDYLEKEERTPQQNVELALSKVDATMTVNKTGDIELPESTIPGVTFTWSTKDSTYSISENKLHVATLPTSDARITATVTATVEGATVTDNTKDVTVTIKAAVTATEGTAVLDFSGVSEKGTAITDGDATEYFLGFASADSNLEKAEVTKIYKGNGTGGAHPNTAGLLKTGTSSAAAQIKLTFSTEVSSVVINCHDFYNDPNPSNTISVNGGDPQDMPHNADGTPEDLTFDLETASEVVTIDFNNRGFVYKITVTFGEVKELTEAEKLQKAVAGLDLSKKTLTTVGDSIDLPATGRYESTITWAMTPTTSGYVTLSGGKLTVTALPEDEDAKVTLTATVKVGNSTDTKTFEITINKKTTTPAPSGDLVLTTENLFAGLSKQNSYAPFNTDHKVGNATITTSQVMISTSDDYPDTLQFQKSAGTITLSGTFTKIVIVVDTSYALVNPTVTVGTTSITGTADAGEAHGTTASGYEIKRYTIEYNITVAGEQTVTIKNANTSGAMYVPSITFTGTPAGGGSVTPAPDPELPEGQTKVSVKISDYATEHDWVDGGTGSPYDTVEMDTVITVKATGTPVTKDDTTYPLNTGKFYGGNNWRIYQNENPNLTFTAKTGYTIVSVKITYNVKNTGVLMGTGANAQAQYESGTTITVNAASVTFTVGNTTATTTNGQVQITAIEVIYASTATAASRAPVAILPGKEF